MTNVLVCIKRVPDLGGEIGLTPDGMDVDDSSLGHTMSPHEDCAVELAIQVAEGHRGPGHRADPRLVRRGRAAPQRAGPRLHGRGPGRGRRLRATGPADVAAAIADVVRAHEAAGTTYDLVLLGNDASDTGDFQVGIRLSYLLDRPVVAGVSTLSVSGGRVEARGGSPDGGTEIFDVALPAVLTVSEGGIEPRYPSIPGRMKAKKVAIEEIAPTGSPTGPGRVRLKLPPTQPSQVEVLGDGPEAAVAVVDLFEKLGVLR